MSTTERLFRIIADFAENSQHVSSMAALSAAIGKVVEPLGYRAVASGRLGNIAPADALHFANWDPAWLEIYSRRGFIRFDPVPMWAIRSGSPITCSELRAILPKNHPGHEVFEAGKPFGYLGGYIIPQRAADGGLGLVSVIGSGDPQSRVERIALRAVASLTFERAEVLSGRLAPKEIPLPSPALTVQEHKCLKFLAAGKKAAQIARLMKISENTVRFHTNNLRRKTGKSSLAELTAFAVVVGLIPKP
jgi:DNA-binding CsgD family transcriptional regulator